MERAQLLAARNHLHLSLQEVADALEVSKATIYRWEKKGDIPQPLHLRKLCDLYSMTAQELGFDDAVIGEQTIATLEESERDALTAFRQQNSVLCLMRLVWNWPRRNARYQELQEAITLELEDNNTMDDSLSRRDALRILALLPIEMSGLSAFHSVSKSPTDEILAQCAAGVTACWHLRRGKEPAFTMDAVSAYLPTLKTIVKTSPMPYRKSAADLLVQCLLLKSTLSWDIATTGDAITYARQAEAYSAIAENLLLQIIALRTQAAALWYAHQRDAALQLAEKAGFLLEQDRKSSSSRPAGAPIPFLVHSYVYAGLATYQAYEGQKEDALLSLKKAHTTFFGQTPDEPVPIWIDHSVGNLLLNDGSTHSHLGLYAGAVDSLQQIDTRYTHDTAIPFSCRVEALIDQVTAEVSRDDGKRDMDRSITLWKQGMDGARTLKSDKKFSEAFQAFSMMRAAWPGEQRVKELREYVVHW